MNNSTYAKLVSAVRYLLGIEFTVNGLNWWIKLITPYPSISDGVAHFPPGDFVAAMIKTGILFHLVKGLELLTGVALLLNLFVPLALVSVLSVTVNVFVVDVFLGHRLRGCIMGSGALLMNIFLMTAYLRSYAPMLTPRSRPDALYATGGDVGAVRTPGPTASAWMRRCRQILGVAALVMGTIMVGWVAVMIVQHFDS